MAKSNSTGEVLSNLGITRIAVPDSDALMRFSSRAWAIHNVLAFMAASVDTDTEDGLPVQCTLIEMREALSSLATDLADASDALRRSERVEAEHE